MVSSIMKSWIYVRNPFPVLFKYFMSFCLIKTTSWLYEQLHLILNIFTIICKLYSVLLKLSRSFSLLNIKKKLYTYLFFYKCYQMLILGAEMDSSPSKCMKTYVTVIYSDKKWKRYQHSSKMGHHSGHLGFFQMALKSKPLVWFWIFLHPCLSFLCWLKWV